MDGGADRLSGRPSPEGAGPGRTKRLWSQIWLTRRSLLLIAVPAAVSAAIVLFVVQPTQTPPPEESVASAWNDSISRLGVWPIYPPEEDVYVGDLWAVLLVNEPAAKVDNTNLGQQPILATSARIGHIDLVGLLQNDEARRLHFREHVLNVEDPSRPRTGASTVASVPPAEVSPSLVAFPGVTIAHARRAATSFGMRWFGWGASNEVVVSDEIHLTETSTYGVPFGEAYGAMVIWCAKEGVVVCSDAYARRVLAQTGISGTLETTPDGSAYVNRIELRLVTRAFLAKVIDQKRSTSGDRGLGTRTSSDGTPAASSGPQSSTASINTESPSLTERGQVLAATSDAAKNGATFVTLRSDGSSIEMRNVTYERPLVFGYRAVSKLLDPITPDKRPKP